MSAPEPTPFAVYVGPCTADDDGHKVLIGGVPIYFGVEVTARRACDHINAAVQRERQAAKAGALRDFAAWCATASAAPNAIGPLFGAGVLSAAKMIGAEATSRAERAEKGDHA